MKEKLVDICDYMQEAACMHAFGSPERLGGDTRFKVPWVWEGSTNWVLVMEYIDSISISRDSVDRLPQADHDEVRSVYQMNHQAARP